MGLITTIIMDRATMGASGGRTFTCLGMIIMATSIMILAGGAGPAGVPGMHSTEVEDLVMAAALTADLADMGAATVVDMGAAMAVESLASESV